MTTIQGEVIAADLPSVPDPPNASITKTPAYPDARDVIARVSAAYMEEDLMVWGYRELGSELLDWSNTTLVVQAEALPEE